MNHNIYQNKILSDKEKENFDVCKIHNNSNYRCTLEVHLGYPKNHRNFVATTLLQ